MNLLQVVAVILAAFWATEMIALIVVGCRAKKHGIPIAENRQTS